MGAFDYGSKSAKRVSKIVNRWSSGGAGPETFLYDPVPAKSLAIGSVTANVLKPILSISGSGAILIAAALSANTTSRTIRLKITLDGHVVFDAAPSAMTLQGSGIVGIGQVIASMQANFYYVGHQRVEFDKSALIECASSLTESAPGSLQVAYEITQ